LQLVWEEYRQAHPEGYRYSWFCERYQHWRRHLDVVLRQEHSVIAVFAFKQRVADPRSARVFLRNVECHPGL
jgi:hypothetical protein